MIRKDDFLQMNETYYQTCQRYLKIKVESRTEEQHLFLIKWMYDGNIRKYLLSIGNFKKINE